MTSTQPARALAIRDLHKRFGAVLAVQGVSFEVPAGEIFSLLGPNGAGKSTTIAMLAGLLRPDTGDAWLMGHSIRTAPAAARACTGVVPQDIALYPDLTARENLAFWGKMYGLRGPRLQQRIHEVLDLVGLGERQNGRVGTFSGGMKRRINIAVALMHRPQIVIMDEPTVGIDPQSRRHILEGVKALNRDGMTVLYTTHYMEEAAELSDQIAIMDHGRIIACGRHADLIRLVGERDRLVLGVSGDLAAVLAAWQSLEGVDQAAPPEDDGRVTLLVDDSNRVLPRLFEAAGALGARITAVDIQEPNLEAVFLHLTGRALRD